MGNTIFRAFLIKYAEIAIKGKNRYMFEDALVESMRNALSDVEGEFEVTKEMVKSDAEAKIKVLEQQIATLKK